MCRLCWSITLNNLVILRMATCQQAQEDWKWKRMIASGTYDAHDHSFGPNVDNCDPAANRRIDSGGRVRTAGADVGRSGGRELNQCSPPEARLGHLVSTLQPAGCRQDIHTACLLSVSATHSNYDPGARSRLATASQNWFAEADMSFRNAVEVFFMRGTVRSDVSCYFFSLRRPLHLPAPVGEAEARYMPLWDDGARSTRGQQHATSRTFAEALGSECEEQGGFEDTKKIYRQSLTPKDCHRDP